MKQLLMISTLLFTFNSFAHKAYTGKNSKCIATLNEGIAKQLKSKKFASFLEESTDGLQIEIVDTYISKPVAVWNKKLVKPTKPGSKPMVNKGVNITHKGMIVSNAGVIEFKGLYNQVMTKKGSFCNQIRLHLHQVK
jgi:hypothetical protein